MANYEQIKEIRNNDNVFARVLGINTREMKKGYALGEMAVRQEHMNINGSVHGGALYALADTIGGSAAAAAHGHRVTTSSGTLDFLAAAMNTDKLICKAEVVKSGKRISVCQTRIYDCEEKLVAIGLFEYAKMKGTYGLVPEEDPDQVEDREKADEE